MFGVTKRTVDPMLDLLYRLEQRMGRVFGEPFRTLDWNLVEPSTAWVPPVDIVEEPERLVFRAEIPGVSKDDIDIKVENGTLILRGEKKQEREIDGETAHRVERFYGAFTRSFALPATIDADKIQARYKDGVLELVLPKADVAKPRKITIVAA